MARKTKEWVGKSDNAMPRRKDIRQRIYDRYKGICNVCKLPIKTGEIWHLDHVRALILGGENKESNLAPAHAHCNLAKGTEETKIKAKANRQRQKHLGIKKPTQKIASNPNALKGKQRTPKQSLPPKGLYR